jgi:hypothetical protein
MKKWEYKVLNVQQIIEFSSIDGPQEEDNQNITSALNNLGKKGWELVQFDPGTDTGIETYYLKKEKK